MPSSHRMIRMTAIVSSIVYSPARYFSNGCATTPSVSRWALHTVVQAFTAVCLTAGLAAAQDPATPADSSASTSEHPVASAAKFLAGGAVGLAAHEAGHLLFDGIFN